LIGGADHILAHAAAGHIGHPCLGKGFVDNIEEVNAWVEKFARASRGKLASVKGDLYHIWHGDVEKRQYLQRIRGFTGQAKDIQERDENGLHVANGKDQYVKQYYREREVGQLYEEGFDGFDAGFAQDMGYNLLDLAEYFGQPTYEEPPVSLIGNSEGEYTIQELAAIQGVDLPADTQVVIPRESIEYGLPQSTIDMADRIAPMPHEPTAQEDCCSSNYS
jgi:hypothetical protein